MNAPRWRRVVVTGMGVIGPLGFDVELLFDRLCRGESGITPITRFDASHSPSRIAGQIDGFRIEDFIDDRPSLRNARLMDGPQQWAMVAAKQAMTMAGLEPDLRDTAARTPVATDRIGVCLGMGMSGRDQMQRLALGVLPALRQWLASHPDTGAAQDPLLASQLGVRMMSDSNPVGMLQQCPSTAAAWLAIRYGARGPNLTNVSLCAASAQALGEAAWMIARGDAEVMLAGGADSMINTLDLPAFARLDAVSGRNESPPAACKPFDLHRDGCVVGEGAAMLVLEERESALARGATILAELAGYGTSADAWKISAPPDDGDGATRAMQSALRHAGLAPQEIDHINAHGTATLLNDRIETHAIRRALGPQADRIPVVSTKSMSGHWIAAAGALEALISIQCLRQGRIPGTRNLTTPDPRCDLDYVIDGPRELPMLRTVMSNSFAIGGVNATLIFRRNDS